MTYMNRDVGVREVTVPQAQGKLKDNAISLYHGDDVSKQVPLVIVFEYLKECFTLVISIDALIAFPCPKVLS